MPPSFANLARPQNLKGGCTPSTLSEARLGRVRVEGLVALGGTNEAVQEGHSDDGCHTQPPIGIHADAAVFNLDGTAAYDECRLNQYFVATSRPCSGTVSNQWWGGRLHEALGPGKGAADTWHAFRR